MKTHHITKDGKQSGPYSIDEIRELIASGELTEDDLCWAQGMTEWEPIRRMLSPGTNMPPPPPIAQESQRSIAASSESPASPHSGSSSLPAALKNLASSLIALGKMIFGWVQSAAKSDQAKQTSKLVAEKSSALCKKAAEMASSAANSDAVRLAAEKINKGATDIRNKASSLAHPEDPSPSNPQHLTTLSTGVAADLLDGDSAPASPTPPPQPASIPATSQTATVNQTNHPARPDDTNHRPINWIPALVFFCLMAAFLCIVEMATFDGAEEEAGMIALVGLPVMLLAVIFVSILHYKCWKTLPTAHRATSPGKAVGFMFIPFFNFYWAFVTWPKLSEGLTDWQNGAGTKAVNTKGLGITFAILFVCFATIGLIPVLGVMIKIAMVVIFILYYFKTVRGLNLMLRSSSTTQDPRPVGIWTFKRTAIGIAVVLPLYWLILGVTYDPNDHRRSSSSGDHLPGWYTEAQKLTTLPCIVCKGAGTEKESCRKCAGTATITTPNGFEIVCPNCRGSGTQLSRCRGCGGSGQVKR